MHSSVITFCPLRVCCHVQEHPDQYETVYPIACSFEGCAFRTNVPSGLSNHINQAHDLEVHAVLAAGTTGVDAHTSDDWSVAFFDDDEERGFADDGIEVYIEEVDSDDVTDGDENDEYHDRSGRDGSGCGREASSAQSDSESIGSDEGFGTDDSSGSGDDDSRSDSERGFSGRISSGEADAVAHRGNASVDEALAGSESPGPVGAFPCDHPGCGHVAATVVLLAKHVGRVHFPDLYSSSEE